MRPTRRVLFDITVGMNQASLCAGLLRFLRIEEKNKYMPQLTKEMYWLAQDIYCRYVVKENLSPKGDIHQIAQTCIALTSEFFAAFEATQEQLRKVDAKALARELPRANSLVVESSAIAQALKPAPAPVEEAPAPLPVKIR
jgi:hypothetical protein